jgi:hypothetical protein
MDRFIYTEWAKREVADCRFYTDSNQMQAVCFALLKLSIYLLVDFAAFFAEPFSSPPFSAFSSSAAAKLQRAGETLVNPLTFDDFALAINASIDFRVRKIILDRTAAALFLKRLANFLGRGR